MEPDDLLCSRNARLKKALVGRAQWKINQPPSLKRKQASFDGSSATSLDGRSGTNKGGLTQEILWIKRKTKRTRGAPNQAATLERENEQAWKDHCKNVSTLPQSYGW
jgi:hypothetical protein